MRHYSARDGFARFRTFLLHPTSRERHAGTFAPMNRFLTFSSLAALTLAPLARAHDQHAVEEMATAARSFLATLDEGQKAKAQFQFSDEERKNWHFIPRPRKGLPLKEMSQGQRLLANALLTTGLSARGFSKAASVMSQEEVLKVLEQGKANAPVRDPENYFFSIFGEPSKDGVWGWRFEGHHLAFNFTAAKGLVVSTTPSFYGTNPGEILEGPRKGQRVLASEEDLGWKLVRSLNDEQKKAAILNVAVPKDVLNDPKSTEPTKPEGVSQAKLSGEQKETLAALIHEYLDTHRADCAAEDWAKIEKAGLEKVSFAWVGSMEARQPHYYRVQGPTFVLELDNTQNDANHVHALYRDLEHDFGGVDPLREHVRTAHAGK